MSGVSYDTLGYHSTAIRVRFGEVDGYGYLWHGHALTYFEAARADLAREHGMGAAELMASEMAIPMVQQSCTYKNPAFDDQELVVQTSLLRPSLPMPFLRFNYRVVRPSTREEILRGQTQQMFVKIGGRVVTRLPPQIRAGLEKTWAYLEGCPRWEDVAPAV